MIQPFGRTFPPSAPHLKAVSASAPGKPAAAATMGNQQLALTELDFMDLYVCLSGDGRAHYRPGRQVEGMASDLDVPEQFIQEIGELADLLRREFDSIEMGINFHDMRLRVAKLQTASGEVWAAMRRVAELPPALEKLGFTRQMVPFLRDLGQRDGLILLCGSTGQGKTTTASALLLDFLKTYGGVAFTIEDPVEYQLEGRQGTSGYCYQAEIQEEAEWGLMLKRSLRWHPRYIFVGEIRTPDAANQLLRAATSGHTVIATMHAGSMEEGLEGLLQLAEVELKSRAALLLAAGLTAVVHQQLTSVGLNASFMTTEAGNPGSPIRALIRDKRIGQTRSFSDQQMALLMRDGELFPKR